MASASPSDAASLGRIAGVALLSAAAGAAVGAWVATRLLRESASGASVAERRPRGKPRRIILVRHGQSLGNVDAFAYETVPDHRLPLTEVGAKQARDAGVAVKKIVGDDRISVYVSPHKRTIQTFQHMLGSFDEGQVVKVRMEPRIREQDFGNFQHPDEMRITKDDRHNYGRFYFRFDNGESGADVYDRVTTFFDTIHREWERPIADASKGAYDTVLIVTHGLTMRLLLMRWFQWSVETFERSRNPSNAEFVVMEVGPDRKYHLATGSPRVLGLTDEQCDYGRWRV